MHPIYILCIDENSNQNETNGDQLYFLKLAPEFSTKDFITQGQNIAGNDIGNILQMAIYQVST